MLPGVFPNKVTSGVDFTDEPVVQCDVPVEKILLQVLVIYKKWQMNLDVNAYVLLLDRVLCIVLISKSEFLHQYYSRILITIITYNSLKYAANRTLFSRMPVTVSIEKKIF